jgi:fluoride ion exporter CrcB/FEX
MTTISVGLLVAGAIGAPCRFLLDGFVLDHTGGAFPWGTFVIKHDRLAAIRREAPREPAQRR